MINTENNQKVAMKKYNLFILKKKTRMQKNNEGKSTIFIEFSCLFKCR